MLGAGVALPRARGGDTPCPRPQDPHGDGTAIRGAVGGDVTGREHVEHLLEGVLTPVGADEHGARLDNVERSMVVALLEP